jgi:hypothetical protein
MAILGSGIAGRTLHRSRRPIAFVVQPQSEFGAHLVKLQTERESPRRACPASRGCCFPYRRSLP